MVNGTTNGVAREASKAELREAKEELVRDGAPRDLFGKEIGTGFDELFPMYETADGKNVFDYGDYEAREYGEMLDRDGQAGKIEQVLSLPLRMLTWEIEPAEGDSGEAELIRQILTTSSNHGGMSTPMHDVIGQMTAAIVNRKSFHEKVYKLGTGDLAGKVVLDQLGWRPPTTCRLLRDADSGAFRGFEQDHPKRDLPVMIKPHRAFVYIHGKHRDPLRGISDLRVPYWCYKTKQKLRFLWYQYLEGQSLPRTIVKGDDQAGAQAQARRLVTLKAAGAIGMERRYDVETLESNGEGSREFKEALRWLNGEMTSAVLASFTDLADSASEGKGSFALSKDQSDFFLMSRNAVAREMASTIDAYLIGDLVRWNFGPDAKAPHFKFAPVGQEDIDAAVTLLSSFGAAQSLKVPIEFVMELVRLVAKKFDLDADKLDKAIKEETERLKKQAETAQEAQLAQVAGAAAGAASEVQKQELERRDRDRADELERRSADRADRQEDRADRIADKPPAPRGSNNRA